jgi:hypothetical protein
MGYRKWEGGEGGEENVCVLHGKNLFTLVEIYKSVPDPVRWYSRLAQLGCVA